MIPAERQRCNVFAEGLVAFMGSTGFPYPEVGVFPGETFHQAWNRKGISHALPV